MVLWVVALVAGAAPRRMWARLEPPLPLFATAFPAAILAISAGFAIGVPGFFAFAENAADENNAWMLRQLLKPGPIYNVALVPYGVSALTLFIFLFLTPTGLVALYLASSGAIRAISAYLDPDDARGDFVLSGIHWVVTTVLRKSGEEMRRAARELREGAEAPDRLYTGEWAGVDADYVLLASRRKAEWNAGAIIMTSTDWYRLGVPFNIETPNGLRAAYPLKRMESAEVVRRGILYELPELTAGPDPKA
jgi:hypothetical protein